MPSAFTEPIFRGNKVTLKDFALRCSMATDIFRDMFYNHGFGKQLPREIKPNENYFNEQKKAEKSLEEITSMSESQLEKKAETEYIRRLNSHIKSVAETLNLTRKYVALLQAAHAWQPPTPKHESLKEFMISQLEQSIDVDCKVDYNKLPEKKSAEEYKTHKIAEIKKEIEYNKSNYAGECKVAKIQTTWLEQLYSSLESEQIKKR